MDYITGTVGNIGEAVALAEFTKRGYTVLIPFGQNAPYDLVVDINNRFYRIQCKSTEKVHDGEKMIFTTCRMNNITYQRTVYTSDEIDYMFVYCIENGYMGLIPIEQLGTKAITIRIAPPRNCQVNRIRMAESYLLDTQIQKMLKSAS